MIETNDIQKVSNYIKSHWQYTVRHQIEDKGTLLGMPYPYTVPCQKYAGMQCYFYWDMYFTNVGLIKQGFHDLAKNNVDNLLYLVEKYGYVPNGNQTFFLDRSQPPLLSMMVREIFNIYKDIEWLKSAHETLKKEYDFWIMQRMTPSGLNRHFHHSSEEELLAFYEDVKDRIKIYPETKSELLEQCNQYLAEGETGWDFTPRFEKHCADFNPVDLNSFLYAHEINAAYFSDILNINETRDWKDKANFRKNLMNQILWNDEKGLYFDCDFVNACHSKIASLATFAPLWMNIASQYQAEKVVENLNLFEYDFGVSVCERTHQYMIYQWDFPNGWPPIFFMTIEGLKNYGFMEDAKRIAEKYVAVIVKNFAATGDLWEKYNIIDGSINVNNEYELPAMLGWTAGVFVYCTEFLGAQV